MTHPSCANCHHHPHPNRACAVVKIDGPPSDQGIANYDTGGYDHIGRDATPCGCTTYTPTLNGHQLPTPESAANA